MIDLLVPLMGFIISSLLIVRALRMADAEVRVAQAHVARPEARWEVGGTVLVWDPLLEREVLDGEGVQEMVDRLEGRRGTLDRGPEGAGANEREPWWPAPDSCRLPWETER